MGKKRQPQRTPKDVKEIGKIKNLYHREHEEENPEQEKPERSFEGAGLRRIGRNLTVGDRTKTRDGTKERNMPSEEPTSARKNPSCHDGQKGCVWLEKVTETLVPSA
jgi:hypothetical protein